MNSQFIQDVVQGFKSEPKHLSSKYFYDTLGDKLFQDIMELDEYYLSRAEEEILREKAASIALPFQGFPLEVLELGAGDGRKTQHLLKELLEVNPNLVYRPLDISSDVLDTLTNRLKRELPNLKSESVTLDYWAGLPSTLPGHKRLVLFLGSNLGNYGSDLEAKFFELIRQGLQTEDHLLLGLDLAKSAERILAAYKDSKGTTANFNLNLLHRINEELEGDFDLSQFKHWAVYDPIEKEARSYLISTSNSTYSILGGQHTFEFGKWEAIHVETSRKYDFQKLGSMAKLYGFEIVNNHLDSREDFVDSLWKRID
jgi:dimethylhistidine N-methyltransferase